MKTSLCILAAFVVFGTVLSACNDGTSPNTDNNTTTIDSSFKHISGIITLSMRITGSRSTSLGADDYTKSEDATVNLSFNLGSDSIHNSAGGGSNCAWHNPVFGGLVNWTEILLTTYDCNGGKATDKETMIKSFSSAASGNQPGGVNITIESNGSYGINIAPGFSGMPTAVTHTIETNCGTPTSNTTTGNGPGVPFSNYFVPVATGGAVTGTVDKSNPSHITGSYTGTDNMTIFDIGTSTITMPIQYTISWDLTRTK